MQKGNKKLINLMLVFALLFTTFVAASAENIANGAYCNDHVQVDVDKTIAEGASEADIKIKLKNKKDNVKIKDIVFPDTTKKVAKKKEERRVHEEVTKDHSYSYKVNENGDYEFLVNYVTTEEVTKEVDVPAPAKAEEPKDADTENTEEKTEAAAPATVKETVTETVETEHEHRFTVKVNEIKETEEGTTDSIDDENEENPEDFHIGDKKEPIAKDGEIVPQAGDWSKKDGSVTMTIPNFDPNQNLVLGDVKNVQVTVNFGEQYKDSDNKKIKFYVAPGLAYITYAVKGNPKHDAETPLLGIQDNLVKSTTGQTKKRYNSVNEEITYELNDRGVDSITLDFVIRTDQYVYLNPFTLAEGLRVEATVGDQSIGKVSTEVIVEDDVILGHYKNSSDVNVTTDGIYSESTQFVKTNLHRTNRTAPYSQIAVFLPKTKMVLPFPPEFDGTNVRGYSSACKFDSDLNAMVCEYSNTFGSIPTTMAYEIRAVGIAPGTYKASEGLYTIYEDFLGREFKTDTTVNGAKYPAYAIKVNPPIEDNNRLDHVAHNFAEFPHNNPNVVNKMPGLTIKSKPGDPTTNQTLVYTIDEDYEVTAVAFPLKNVNEIKYKTNLDSTLRSASGSQIVKTDTNVYMNKRTLNLPPDEFITYAEAHIGNVPPNYDPRQANTVNYHERNEMYVLGRLKDGATSASIKLESFERDTDGEIIEKTYQESVSNVSKAAEQKHGMYNKGNSVQVTAGERRKHTLDIKQSDFYAGNTLAVENPKIYLKMIDGLSYENIVAKKIVRDHNKLSLISDTGQYNYSTQVVEGVGGINYLEVSIEGLVGGYANNDNTLLNLEFDIVANRTAGGFYTQNDLFFFKYQEGTSALSSGPFTNHASNVLEQGDRLQAVPSTQTLNVIPQKALFVESSITKNNESVKQNYDGTRETAIGFTVKDKLNYFVDIINRTEANVDTFTAYVPVPREGINFGIDFQDETFPWNTKIESVDIKVYDANGNDVTDSRKNNYRVEYSAINAADAPNYQTANYGSSYTSDTTMIRVRNTNPIPDGEHAQIKVRYEIDETADTITDEKLDALLEFNPYFNYVGGGSSGWGEGSETGSYLSIGQLQGRVFVDENYNGLWNSGEEYLANVKVVLRDENGAEIASSTTEADGLYTFNDLGSGKYTLDFTDALNQYPYFTFRNKHTGTQIGSIVPNTGDKIGLADNVDPGSDAGKRAHVGVLKYRPEDLTITGTEVKVREENTQTPGSSASVIPVFNDANYQGTLQASGYPLYAIEDNTIAYVDAQGEVTGKKAGTTNVVVTTQDIFGNTITGTIKVTVTANHEPTITFNAGKESLLLNVGDTYNKADGVVIKQGTTTIPVTDNRVTVTPDNVDMTRPGVTKVTYKYVDAIGNKAEASRLVAVNDGTIEQKGDYFIQGHNFSIASNKVATGDPAKIVQVRTLADVKAWNVKTLEVVTVDIDVSNYKNEAGTYDVRLTPAGQTAQGKTIKATVTDGNVDEFGNYYIYSKHGYGTVNQIKSGAITTGNVAEHLNVRVVHKVTGADGFHKLVVTAPGFPTVATAKEGNFEISLSVSGETGTPVKQMMHIIERDNILVTDDYAIVSNNITYNTGEITGKSDTQVMLDAQVLAHERNENSQVNAIIVAGTKPNDVPSQTPYTIKYAIEETPTVRLDSKITIETSDKPVISHDRIEKTVEVKKTATKPNKAKVIADFGLTAKDAYGNPITDLNSFEMDGLDAVDFTVTGTYDVLVKVKDASGLFSDVKTYKYKVQDTEKPLLTIQNKNLNYSNTKINPLKPTLAELEASGIFGTITKEDDNNASGTMPLQSLDYDANKMAQAGNHEFNVFIEDAAGNKSDSITIKIKVTLYDDIDYEKGWALVADNFNAQVSEVTNAGQIINKAGAKVYDIKKNPQELLDASKAEIIPDKTSLNIGENQAVTFTVRDKQTNRPVAGLSKTVNANVYSVIKDGYAILADDIVAQESEVQTAANIRNKAGVQVFDATNPNQKPTLIANAEVLVKIGTKDITSLSTGRGQTVTFVYKDKPTVKTDVNADIYDQIANNYAILAHDFVAKLDEVDTSAKIARKAEAEIYNLSTNSLEPGAVFVTSPDKLGIGIDQNVKISSYGLEKIVKADVHEEYDGTYGISAKDEITAALNILKDQGEGKLLRLANVEAWKYENGVRKPLAITDLTATPVPTTIGNSQEITYSIKNTTVNKKGIVNVVESHIDFKVDKAIVLNLEDSKVIDANGLVIAANASAKVDGRILDPKVSAADVKKVNDVKQAQKDPVTIEIKVQDAPTGDEKIEKVKVYITENYDDINKIGIYAEDFKTTVDKINANEFKKESKVRAYDYSKLPNTPQEISLVNITVNEEALANKKAEDRPVKFTAVTDNREASKTVTGHIFDALSEDGEFAFNIKPEFSLAAKNVNKNNMITESGVKAWYVKDLGTKVPIGNDKITPSPINNAPGTRDVIFTATHDGKSGNVKSKMTVLATEIDLKVNKHNALSLSQARGIDEEDLLEIIVQQATVPNGTVVTSIENLQDITGVTKPNVDGIDVIVNAKANNSSDTTKASVKVYIFDAVENAIGLNAHDFILEFDQVSDGNARTKAGAAAYDLSSLPNAKPVSIAQNHVAVDGLKKELGNHNVTFSVDLNGVRTINKTVLGTVVDGYNPDNKEGINAHDFTISQGELLSANGEKHILKKSGAQRVDLSDPQNITYHNDVKVKDFAQLPTDVGQGIDVTLITTKGTEFVVKMNVVETLIELTANNSVVLQANQISGLTETTLLGTGHFNAKAKLGTDNITPKFAAGDMDRLKGVKVGQEAPIDMTIIADGGNGDTTSKAVKVYVVDSYNPTSKIGINAVDFVIKVNDISAANYKTKGQVKAYDYVNVENATPTPIQDYNITVNPESLDKVTGQRDVIFTATSSGRSESIKVQAYAFDQVENDIAMNVRPSFEIAKNNATEENMKTESGVKAWYVKDIDSFVAIDKSEISATPSDLTNATSGTHEVTFTAKHAGKSANIKSIADISETDIKLEVNSHIAISLADAKTMNEAKLKDLAVKEAKVNNVNATVTFDDITPITGATKPNADGVTIKVTATDPSSGSNDTTSKNVVVYIFDHIDPNVKLAINAHDFVLELKDFTQNKIRTAAGASSYDLSGLPVVAPSKLADNEVTAISGTEQVIGERKVMFQGRYDATRIIRREVTGTVVDGYNPDNNEAINANDFEVAINELLNGDLKDIIISKSNAERLTFADGQPTVIDNEVDVKDIDQVPQTIGTHTITLTTEKGTEYNVKMTVVQTLIDLKVDSSIVLKVSELSGLTDSTLLSRLHANAKLGTETITPEFGVGEMAILKAITKGQKDPVVMTVHATAQNKDTTSKAVKVYVVDDYDETSKIGINAHDFSAKVSEVDANTFKTKAGVEAYDYSKLPEGSRVTIASNYITVDEAGLNKAPGERDVKFNVLYDNRAADKTVKGHIFDSIQGKFAFDIKPKFTVAKGNANEEEYIKQSEIVAYYIDDLDNVVTIDKQFISVETAIDNSPGEHGVTFKAEHNGESGTVTSTVLIIDSNIELKVNKHNAITVDQAQTIDEDFVLTLVNARATSNVNEPVKLSIADMTVLDNITKPNVIGIQVKVIANSTQSGDTTEETATIYVFDKIENQLAMNAHDFIIELDEVSDNNAKTKAELGVYNLASLPNSKPVSLLNSNVKVTGMKKELGNHIVNFYLEVDGTRTIADNVNATVVNKNNPDKNEAINAHDFTISKGEFSEENILLKSGAERVEIIAPGNTVIHKDVKVKDFAQLPTDVGTDIPVTLITDNGTEFVVKMTIVDSLITLTSKDSVVVQHSELAGLSEGTLLGKLEATAKLGNETITPKFKDGDLAALKALERGQDAPVIMTITATAQNGDTTSKDVKVYVVDYFEPSSKIGVNAHDFVIKANDISAANYKTKANVKAFDYQNVENGTVTPIPNISIDATDQDSLAKTTGLKNVVFTAKSGGREGTAFVTAYAFNALENNIGMNVRPNFEIAKGNVTEANLRTESGVRAWAIDVVDGVADLNNITDIAPANITADPIPTTSGNHVITFTATHNGKTASVKSTARVSDTDIKLEVNPHIAISLADAKTMNDNKLLNLAVKEATINGADANLSVDDITTITGATGPNMDGVTVKVTAKDPSSDDETSKSVVVYILDQIDPNAKLGINAHGFVIELIDFTTNNIRTEAEAAAYDLSGLPAVAPSKLADNVVLPISGTEKVVGNRKVMFEAKYDATRSIRREVDATVVDGLNPGKDEAINAHDFTISRGELLSPDAHDHILKKSEAERVVIVKPGETTTDKQVKVTAPDPLPTTTGNYTVELSTDAGTKYEVTMEVVDTLINFKIDSSIVIKHNELSGLTEAELLARLHADAKLGNQVLVPVFGAGELDALKALTSGRKDPVIMTAHVSADNGDKTSKSIKVYVVDDYDETSQIGINAHDFTATVSEVNANTFKTKAGVEAYDYSKLPEGSRVTIASNYITVDEAALAKKPGTRDVKFNVLYDNRAADKTVKGHIYNKVDGDFAFDIKDEFIVAKGNANEEEYITQSEIVAYYIKDLNNIETIDRDNITLETAIDNSVGKHDVTFKATHDNKSATVDSRVQIIDSNIELKVDKHNAITVAQAQNIDQDFVLNLLNATATSGVNESVKLSIDDMTVLDNITEPNILGIKVKVIAKSEDSDDITEETAMIYVFDKIENQLAMNSHDFIIKLSEVSDDEAKIKAGLGVYNLASLPNSKPVTVTNNRVEVNGMVKELGNHDVNFYLDVDGTRTIQDTVKATVVNGYDPNTGEGINAHDFTISKGELSEENILLKSEAERVEIIAPGNTVIHKDVKVKDFDQLPTDVGSNIPVTLITDNGTEFVVRMNIVDSLITLTSKNSVILKQSELAGLTEGTLLGKFEASAKLGNETITPKFQDGDLDALKAIEKGQEAPINMVITATAQNGDTTSKDVKVYVVDYFEPSSRIGINAHDFVIQVSEINADNYKIYSEVKAYDYQNVENGVVTDIPRNNILVNPEDPAQTAGRKEIRFTAKSGGREAYADVIGYAYDKLENNIGMNVRPNFEIAKGNVTEANLRTESAVRAWYVADINNFVEIQNDTITANPVPTTSGNHTITFTASHDGKTATIDSIANVSDTDIKLEVNPHIAITLADAIAMNDNKMIDLAVKEATINGVDADLSVEDISTITSSTKPNMDGITVKVTAKDPASSDSTSKSVVVYVLDQIDDNAKLGINAHGFIIELARFTTNNIRTAAEAAAYDLSGLPAIAPSKLADGVVLPISGTEQVVGDRKVMFEAKYDATRSIQREVDATVVNGLNPGKDEAINANDFTISLGELSEETILKKSNAERVIIVKPGETTTDDQVKVVAPDPLPTTTGSFTVTLATENGATLDVNMTVVDTLIDLKVDSGLVLKVSELSGLTETALLGRLNASAKLGTENITPVFAQGDMDRLTAITAGQKDPVIMTVHATAQNNDTTSKAVKVYVVDDYDETSQIGINAHDFKAKVSEVDANTFKIKAGVEAYDYSKLPEGSRVTIASNYITVDEAALTKAPGERDVKFSVLYDNRAADKTVKGHIFDSVTPDGKFAFNVKDKFIVAQGNASEEEYIKQSAVEAFYVVDLDNVETVDTQNITVDTPIDNSVGEHPVTFKATHNGDDGKVNSIVKIIDTNIKLVVNKHNAVTVTEVETMDENAVLALVVAQVESSVGENITTSIEDMTVLDNIVGPNVTGIQVKVIAKSNNSGDTTEETAMIYVFDEINSSRKVAINAHDFFISLADVNEANFKTTAEAKAYSLENLPNGKPVVMANNSVKVTQGLDKVLGERDVEFFAELNSIDTITRKVKATVFDNYDPVKKEGINANDFTIALTELTNERILEKSNATRFVVAADGTVTSDKQVSVVAPNPLPTTAGNNIPVTLESAGGVRRVVRMNVVDTLIELTSKDSIVIKHDKLAALTESSLLGLLEAHAELDGQVLDITIEDGQLDALKALEKGQEAPVVMTIKTEATNADGSIKDKTEKTVNVYVFDDYDEDSMIGINANDFKVDVKEINETTFKRNSGVKAYDFEALPNGQPKEIISSNIHVNPESLADKNAVDRDVTFTAKLSNRENSTTVKAYVFDSLDGNIAFRLLPKFTVASKNANETNYINQSLVRAWYVADLDNQVEIPTQNISVVSTIHNQVGEYDVDFSAIHEDTQTTGFAKSRVEIVSTKIDAKANKHIAMDLQSAGSIKSEDLETLFNVEATSPEGNLTVTFDQDNLDAIEALQTPQPNGVKVSITIKSNTSSDETKLISTVHVFDKVSDVDQLAMNGHGFVIELDEMNNDDDLKLAAEAGTWNLKGLPNQAPNALLTSSTKVAKNGNADDKSLGDRIVTFENSMEGTRQIEHKVPVTVVHKYDEAKSEGINANDFTIAIKELSEERILEKANAQRVIVDKPGTSTTDGKVKVVSPQPDDYPVSARNNVPVVLETENGVIFTIHMNVLETNITIENKDIITISLEQAQDMTDAKFLEYAEVKVGHLEDKEVLVEVDADQLDAVNNLKQAPQEDLEIKVTATVDENVDPKDTVTRTIKVRVFDVISGNYGIRSNHIVAKTSDVTTHEDIYSQTGIKVTRLDTNRDVYTRPDNFIFIQNNKEVTKLDRGVNQEVLILGPNYDNAEILINANIYDDYDKDTDLGILAENFVAKRADVDTSDKVVDEAQAMVFDGKTALERPDLTITSPEAPLALGKQTIHFKHNSLSIAKTADIYVEYNKTNQETMNVFDFVIELNKINDANARIASNVEAFTVGTDLSTTEISNETITVTGLDKSLGEKQVTFSTGKGTSVTVTGYVVDEIDEDSMIAFKGHDFDIELTSVSEQEFATLSEIKAYDISDVINNGMVEITPTLTSELPTTVGTHDVEYTAKVADRTATYDLNANVFNHIDPITNESMNAHDFVIQLADITEDNVKAKAELEAYKLLGNGKTEVINLNDIQTSALPSTLGEHDITFTTAAGTKVTVTAYVVNEIDEDSMIAFDGHNFDVELTSVSEQEFATLSEIKAYDISDVVNNGMVEITPTLTSDLPTTVGTHDVEYTAKVADRTATYDLNANVFNHIDPITNESMNAHDFVIQLADITEDTVKFKAELEAYKLLGNGKTEVINLNDIQTSALPSTLGEHDITFTTAAGTKVTVTAYVVDELDEITQIAFRGHNFDVELTSVSEQEFARLSEIKAYDVSDVVNNGMVEITPTLTSELPTTVGTHGVEYTAKVADRIATYDLNANVFNHIDPNTNESMNAHDFVIQLADVNEENVKIKSELEAYKLLGEGKTEAIDVTDIKTSTLPKTLGEHDITFTTNAGTSIKVTAYVVDEIDEMTQIAFRGHNFDIELTSVSEREFARLSEIKAYDISDVVNNGMVEITPVLTSDLPNTIGTHDVEYTATIADRTSTYDLEANVFNYIDPITKESMNAHDFVIELKDITEDNVKAKSELEAYKLLGEGEIEVINLNDISTSELPTSTGTHDITFTTDAGTFITVKAYVVDEIDEKTEIVFTGVNFSTMLDEVSEEIFAQKSRIKAYDASDVINNGLVEIDTKLESELPSKIGTYDVIYSASVKDESSEYKLEVNVFNHIDPATGESMNAHNFAVKLNELSVEKAKELSGLVAYKLVDGEISETIPNSKISVSELPTTKGSHPITFTTEAGTSMTVLVQVFDNGTVEPGVDGIYANDFTIGIHELNVQNVLAKSGVYAYDYSVEPAEIIPVDNVILSSLPNTPGVYRMKFALDSGTSVEVNMTVTATYKVEGNNAKMTIADFNKAVASGTLEETVIKKTNAKAYVVETNQEVGPLTVEFKDGVPSKVKNNQVSTITVKYEVDTALVTRERGIMARAMNFLGNDADEKTVYTKEVEITFVKDGKDIDDGKGGGTDDGKGGGKLPTTGVSAEYTFVVLGVAAIASGAFFIVLSKRRKREEENNEGEI